MAREQLGFGLVVVAAIAVLGSCRQIAGIEESPQVDISTSADGLEFGTGACAACAHTFCSAMSMACSETKPCKAYENCLGACAGDAKCRSQCTEDNHIALGSTDEASQLGACLASHCESDCNISCGGVSSYVTPSSHAAPCDACLVPSCAAGHACGTSIDCDSYIRCLLACPTPDCQQACAAQHSEGFGLYQSFDAARKSCLTECAYGNNWACVGHRSLPPVELTNTMKTTLIIENVWDRTTVNTVIPGAEVTICGMIDTAFTCSPAVTQPVYTNAEGTAQVDVPTVPTNSVGGGGLVPFARIHASDYPDSNAFLGFPLSEPQLTIGPPFTPSVFLNPGAIAGDRGQVWGVAFDCLGALAGGVHVMTADGQAEAIGGAGTASIPGSSAGVALFFSLLPAGPLRLVATPMGANKASSIVDAEVFPGANSIVALFPNQ